MHGLGNDFIVLDLRSGIKLPPKTVLAALTDRKTGIGCDQLITINQPQDEQADAYMGIYNAPDASMAQACGNATRCVASLLMQESDCDQITIQTVAGLLVCRALNDEKTMIEADMGAPKLNWADIPLKEEKDTLHLGIGQGAIHDPVAVNVGNPHAVFFVDDVESLDVPSIGPDFEHHPLFPEKANIEFAQVLDNKRIRMRVWERDTGETQACGSAACATIIAAVRRGLADRRCEVILNGGSLHFEWRENDDHILMSGPASFVYKGEIDISDFN